MTDTKLLRHSLDSAASLKPQKRRELVVPGGGYTRRPPHAAPTPIARPPQTCSRPPCSPPGRPQDIWGDVKSVVTRKKSVSPRAVKVSSPHARSPPAAPEQSQTSLPASKRITFSLDLNLLVLTVLEKPFKRSVPPIP
ncbi:uncharacterized protein LOC144581736 isoform X1 [Callithrix jacchus]